MLNWYVGPWLWDTQPFPHWRAPAGTVGMDLRSVPIQAVAGGSPGVSVFVGEVRENAADYQSLGSGSWNDLKPTARQLASIPKRKGYAPQGDTLATILFDVLTNGADPTGQDGPRPIVPTMALRVELECGERVGQAFTWGSGHTSILKQQLRAEFAEHFRAAHAGEFSDPQQHRRMLDFWCQKYRVDDWREFVPLQLVKDVPGRMPHATTINESFATTDGAALGPDLGWTVIAGTWDVFTSYARKNTHLLATEFARCTNSLSSADMYAQIVLRNGLSSTAQMPVARMTGSAMTGYCTFNFSNVMYLSKFVAGTQTNITNSVVTYAAGDTYKVEINGSALKSYNNGSQTNTTTDTAVTGNTYAGIGQYNADTNGTIDTFQAADLATASQTGVRIVSVPGLGQRIVGGG